jgi:hypothetical protein
VKIFVLAALAACGSSQHAQPTPTGGATTPIVWNAGNGWVTLTVDAAGVATYNFHPTGFGAQGRTPETKHLELTAAEVHDLEQTIVTHHACKLHASGRLPVPEEGSQSLALAIDGARCTVEMLANDWRVGADATAISVALDQLAERVRTTGH